MVIVMFELQNVTEFYLVNAKSQKSQQTKRQSCMTAVLYI